MSATLKLRAREVFLLRNWAWEVERKRCWWWEYVATCGDREKAQELMTRLLRAEIIYPEDKP